MNINNILFYRINIFGDNARRTEERQILSNLNEARIREKILSSARAYEVDGENVQADLEQTKSQITDLTNRIPHGDNQSFYIFCIWCIISISVLVYFYRGLHNIIMLIWGSLDNNWYAQRYRSFSLPIYKAGCFITSSIWFAVLAVLLLLFLWHVQKRLQHSQARRLLLIIAILEIVTVLVLAMGAFGLLIGPICIMS